MSPLKVRIVLSAVILSLISAAAHAETAEDVARRFLTLAYEGSFDALPKAPAARTDRFERQIRNSLRVRCLQIEQTNVVSVVARDEENATVDVDIVLAKNDPQNPRVSFALDFVLLRLELVHKGGRWLVAEVRNRDEDLAEELLAQSRDQRDNFLCQRPDRVSRGLARALYARAMALLNSGKFRDAADVAALTRRVAFDAGDRGGEALALGAAAHAAAYGPTNRDDPFAHIELAKEALEIAQSLGDPDILARAWYDRGRNKPAASRWKPQDPVRAPEPPYYQNALRYAERAEDPTVMTRVLYSMANYAANAQSDYLSARNYVDRGIAIAREVGDANGEMGFETVLTTLYFNQGDRERGHFHNARATELAQKLHAYAYATLLMRAAYELTADSQFEKARAAFARVLTRTDKGLVSTVGPVPGNVIASAARALGIIEAESGNLAEAECLIREIARYSGSNPNAYLFELAPFYARRGDHATALAFSLASLEETGLYSNQAVAAAVAAGRAYRSLGLIDRGLATALEAIEIREGVDSRTAGDEQQRAFASSATTEVYQLAAELALDRGDPVQALAFLERGRARVLTDILENGRPGSMADADDSLRQQQLTLDREVSRITAALDQARIAGKNRLAANLTAQLNGARDVRAAFVDGLQARTERRQATHRQIDSTEVLEVVKRLPPRMIGLEYLVGDHDVRIFVIARDASGSQRVISRTKRVERKELEQSVHTFLDMLSGNDLRVEAAARDVYKLLIDPIESELSDADALLIVPDEVLWRVPFAALIDPRGRFLVERTAITYAPSMTAFATIVDSARTRKHGPVSLLAIGNPTLDQAASKAAATYYRDATLGPLPDAEHEVDAVRKFYDPRQTIVLKQAQATEERTKTALRNASIAHFATHAILDDANPMYSRLMLAHDDAATEDGWLEGWEVAGLDLKADLVVLSACETGLGKLGGGEGVVGLSWSFFIGGARSTLATQWKISSESTAEFMIAFHRALRGRATDLSLHKARALRTAQLQLLHDARTSHPFHWAPFVLLGDPSTQ